MGYSTPKEDFVTYDAHTGEYELSIPFLSALPGVPVDEAEVHILVPEGARSVGPDFDVAEKLWY